MSRRALLKNSIGKLKLALGYFDNLKRIDAERIERLVFVCRGNVCRSPYGEAVAISMGFSAISCGVEVTRSDPAEEMAVSVAHLRGKDLSRHMSRSIYDVPLNISDCLVAMDPSHLPVAIDVASRIGCQITLIGIWRKPAVAAIADPYGKPITVFIRCFDEIDDGLDCLVTTIGIMHN